MFWFGVSAARARFTAAYFFFFFPFCFFPLPLPLLSSCSNLFGARIWAITELIEKSGTRKFAPEVTSVGRPPFSPPSLAPLDWPRSCVSRFKLSWSSLALDFLLGIRIWRAPTIAQRAAFFFKIPFTSRFRRYPYFRFHCTDIPDVIGVWSIQIGRQNHMARVIEWGSAHFASVSNINDSNRREIQLYAGWIEFIRVNALIIDVLLLSVICSTRAINLQYLPGNFSFSNKCFFPSLSLSLSLLNLIMI